MKIGALAQATGTQPETIRYYEREGLLPPPGRNTANYREYGPAHLDQLAFIRHCRNLDMTLDEIRTLLALRNDPQQSCDAVNGLIDEHLGHVRQRIAALRHLEAQLAELRQRCQIAHRVEDCGILAGLDTGPENTVPVPTCHSLRPADSVHR
ncbi:MAG: Cd(II)/Pb(II)-responsive transcriptional regulator [Pigmentiphaga sp.]